MRTCGHENLDLTPVLQQYAFIAYALRILWFMAAAANAALETVRTRHRRGIRGCVLNVRRSPYSSKVTKRNGQRGMLSLF